MTLLKDIAISLSGRALSNCKMGRALRADRTCCLHILRLLSATGCMDSLPFEDQVTVFLPTGGKCGHLARQYLVHKIHCATTGTKVQPGVRVRTLDKHGNAQR